MVRAKKQQGPLPDYEGKPVVSSRITVPSLAGGLRDALDVDPVAIRHGEEGYLLVHWTCVDVNHPPYKGDDVSILAREHKLKPMESMIVGDGDDIATVKIMLAANADRVQRAKDSMAGQGTLDDEVPDDELSPDELKVRRALQGKKDDD